MAFYEEELITRDLFTATEEETEDESGWAGTEKEGEGDMTTEPDDLDDDFSADLDT